MSRVVFTISLLSILVIVSGCSDQPTTYVVHGMVVYPDGKPLTRGTIEFELIAKRNPITASGEIAPDGTFQVGTFEALDGAVAGRHRVAVIADYDIGTEVERPELLPPELLDSKFSDFKTSGLEFEIAPKRNSLLVEVDYAPVPGSEGVSGDDPALLPSE